MAYPGSGCADVAREPVRSASLPLATVFRMGVPTRAGAGEGALLGTEVEAAVVAGRPVASAGGEARCRAIVSIRFRAGGQEGCRMGEASIMDQGQSTARGSWQKKSSAHRRLTEWCSTDTSVMWTSPMLASRDD